MVKISCALCGSICSCYFGHNRKFVCHNDSCPNAKVRRPRDKLRHRRYEGWRLPVAVFAEGPADGAMFVVPMHDSVEEATIELGRVVDLEAMDPVRTEALRDVHTVTPMKGDEGSPWSFTSLGRSLSTKLHTTAKTPDSHRALHRSATQRRHHHKRHRPAQLQPGEIPPPPPKHSYLKVLRIEADAPHPDTGVMERRCSHLPAMAYDPDLVEDSTWEIPFRLLDG